jgi:hypothetical protein
MTVPAALVRWGLRLRRTSPLSSDKHREISITSGVACMSSCDLARRTGMRNSGDLLSHRKLPGAWENRLEMGVA